jgi:hypothetical protein
VTEALVLSQLARTPSFSKHTNVYSHLWPRREDCPFNFEYYVSGYKARNAAIAQYADQNPGNVLLVSDIEKFYPSILRNPARVRFNKALNQSTLPADIRTTASKLLEHLFSGADGETGIATGPDLSHVIGDLALRNVDEVLGERYGKAYFRYVDDIVIAVPVSEVQAAFGILSDAITKEGLTVHQTKTDEVLAKEWIDFGPHNSHGVRSTSFEALVFLLKVYLLRKPQDLASLGDMLRSEGFSIPLERIAHAGRQESFVRRLIKLKRRGWWVAVRALVASRQDVLRRANEIRENVETELAHVMAMDPPEGATRRKWHVQRLRYLSNRALYLIPHTDLRFLQEGLREWPEFAETVALLKLLIDLDPSDILAMPGPGLTAGAEFLKQLGHQIPIGHRDMVFTSPTVDSLSILLMYGVARTDAQIFEQAEPDDSELLKFSAGIIPDSRVRSDFSYIDEIRCLQLGRIPEDNILMLESRFSEQERVFLDALDIGGDYDY